MTNPLDPGKIKLDGIRLIEASAGTGKTYTITQIFIRLLVEKKIEIENILVVTFTEAATAELRERIRSRLQEALKVFETGESTDTFYKDLLERVDVENAREAINRALEFFDLAAIHTIHGFCSQILSENAFESGVPFNSEIVSDIDPLLEEIVNDFWVNRVYDEDPLLVSYLQEQNLRPGTLTRLVEKIRSRPTAEILPKRTKIPENPDPEDWKNAYQECRKSWLETSEEIKALLLADDTNLNRNKYRENSLLGWLDELDDFFESESESPFELPIKFDKFTPSGLEEGLKPKAREAGASAPTHPFFDACGRLAEKTRLFYEWLEARVRKLKLDLADEIRTRFPQRMQDRGLMGFDDILRNLDAALQSSRGEHLAETISKRYHAALIDEFQDTDPIQYRIFQTIQSKGDLPVFLIGDPKQAIYSFRGADIFAYLDAVSDAGDNIYTMETNWRSDPELVRAFNTLFGSRENPFHIEEISYQDVSSERKNALTINSENASGLDIIRFECEHETRDGKARISKSNGNYRIARQLCSSISSLLEENALLDGRKVLAADIAVLVRTSQQARNVQDALRSANIPSVVNGGGNIFHTPEILELYTWLEAITNPSSVGKLRAALSTSLLGLNANQIDGLEHDDEHDEQAWDQWIERFREWNDSWGLSGFISLFRSLMEWKETPRCKSVQARVLSRPNGEREMTNLLHAAELIHAEASCNKLGPARLMVWLENKLTSEDTSEAEELRLESDTEAVRIVTIHSSKGLQYPIVFCPYSSYGPYLQQTDRQFQVYHDRDDNNKLKLNISPEEPNPGLAMVQEELFAEDMRLLYVALTRARNLCTIFWGPFLRFHKSALAWLLQLNSEKELEIQAAVEKLCEDAGGSIRLRQEALDYTLHRLPRGGDSESFSCRVAERKLSKSWKTSSYSGLTSKNHYTHPHQAAGQDHEDDDNSATAAAHDDHHAPLASPILLKGFGGGALAGSCIHSIYEHLDFTESDPSHLEELARENLDAYGLDSTNYLGAVCETIRETLHTPLDPAVNGLTLGIIGEKERLDEMRFLLPVSQDRNGSPRDRDALDPGRLAEAFSRTESSSIPAAYADRIAALNFSDLRGFLTGFIDLTFVYDERWYIVDYKSNHLGDKLGDYGPENISESMMSHHYFLQYHVYTVALHRYLQNRLQDYDYERHFGGVYYLFIKGMKENLGSGNGIFRDRPPVELIENLSSVFEGVKI